MSHIKFSFTATLSENHNDIQPRVNPRYNKRTIPDVFISSKVWKENIAQLIQHFEMQLKSQSYIDSSYQTFTELLVKEMNLYLKLPNVSKTINILVDDITLILLNLDSVKNSLTVLKQFSNCACLNINVDKNKGKIYWKLNEL